MFQIGSIVKLMDLSHVVVDNQKQLEFGFGQRFSHMTMPMVKKLQSF